MRANIMIGGMPTMHVSIARKGIIKIPKHSEIAKEISRKESVADGDGGIRVSLKDH